MIVTVECDMIMVVKIYSGVMGNYFTVSLLLSAKKCYILLCRCSAYKFVLWVRCLIDAYGNCNAEPTIIRRVLRENLQNNGYCSLDDKPENVN